MKRRQNRAKTFTVWITDSFTFSPRHIQIRPGDSVTWSKTNFDPETQVFRVKFLSPHGHDGDEEAFEISKQSPSFTHKFKVPANLEYYCEFHVFMRGQLTVEASAATCLTTRKPSPQQLLRAPSTVDNAEYHKYVSKRKSTRDKLAKAREQRKMKESLGIDESVPQEELPTSTEIRFGRFDQPEEDEDEEEGEEKTAVETVLPAVLFKSPLHPLRFGSFCDEQEFDVQAAVLFLEHKWTADLQEIHRGH